MTHTHIHTYTHTHIPPTYPSFGELENMHFAPFSVVSSKQNGTVLTRKKVTLCCFKAARSRPAQWDQDLKRLDFDNSSNDSHWISARPASLRSLRWCWCTSRSQNDFSPALPCSGLDQFLQGGDVPPFTHCLGSSLLLWIEKAFQSRCQGVSLRATYSLFPDSFNTSFFSFITFPSFYCAPTVTPLFAKLLLFSSYYPLLLIPFFVLLESVDTIWSNTLSWYFI